MDNKTKIIGAFVLGAVAGIALKKLLESEKGEQVISQTKETFEKTLSDFETTLHALQTEVKNLLQKDIEPKA